MRASERVSERSQACEEASGSACAPWRCVVVAQSEAGSQRVLFSWSKCWPFGLNNTEFFLDEWMKGERRTADDSGVTGDLRWRRQIGRTSRRLDENLVSSVD